RLRDEPHTGHNRWHPDIAPIVEVGPGEELALETRDANDLQIGPRTTAKDLERLERTVAHPLTGPVFIKGAAPGDLLEVEYLEIVPERYGWTRFAPPAAASCPISSTITSSRTGTSRANTPPRRSFPASAYRTAR